MSDQNNPTTLQQLNHPQPPPAPVGGAIAELLDLDFGPVQSNNDRQYILEQQNSAAVSVAASASIEVGKSAYSTREPLRPSIEQAKYCDSSLEAAALAAVSAGQLILPTSRSITSTGTTTAAAAAAAPPPPPLSSNSSTASSSGSRRASAASSRKQAESQSALDSSGVLRDTKIEIAGKQFTNVLV